MNGLILSGLGIFIISVFFLSRFFNVQRNHYSIIEAVGYIFYATTAIFVIMVGALGMIEKLTYDDFIKSMMTLEMSTVTFFIITTRWVQTSINKVFLKNGYDKNLLYLVMRSRKMIDEISSNMFELIGYQCIGVLSILIYRDFGQIAVIVTSAFIIAFSIYHASKLIMLGGEIINKHGLMDMT